MRRHSSQGGATLIEVLIGAFIVLVILGILFTAVAGISGVFVAPVRGHAEGYARNYSSRFFGWNSPIVECSGTDSDHNGYVTCTISERVGVRPQLVECASNIWFEFNKNCRAYRSRTVDVSVDQQ